MDCEENIASKDPIAVLTDRQAQYTIMPKSRVLILFLLVLLSSLELGAQATAGAKPDYSQQAFIVERYSISISFEADGTATREAKAEVRLQSDAGVQQFGLLNFSYAKANETVDIVYVRVRKPDGNVIATPEGNVQEMPAEVTRAAPFYSDLREKHVAVRGLSSGDTLEYLIRTHVTNPHVPGQFWFEHTFMTDAIVKDEVLEISVPKDKFVNLKSPTDPPTVREENSRRIYTWKRANLEIKAKKGKEAQEETGDAPAPSVELTTFRSWDEIGRWYGQLQRDRSAVTPEIRAKALELTREAKSDGEKVEAIYHYVATGFRYISLSFGVGRYQPHSASDVLANEYGDCKDKHTLFAALLSAVGIQARPALVSSSRKLDPDLPSPSQFDHVITLVEQGKEGMWLDTTTEVAPPGLLGANLRDKQALVVFDTKAPALMKTPANPPFPTSVGFKVEAKLGSDGVLTGHIDRRLRGDLELVLRLAFRRVPRAQWKDLIQQISYASGFAGDVANVNASSPEDTKTLFNFQYDYTRKDYPDWDNRKLNPPLPAMVARAGDEKPSRPTFLGAPGELVYEAKVQLPQGYSAVAPQKVDLKEDFAEYHATYGSAGETFTVERRFVIHHANIAVSEWAEYRKFSQAVADDHDRWIELRSANGRVILGKPRGGGEADSLLAEAVRAMQRRDIPAARDYLQKTIAIDPKHENAWAMLATIHLFQNQPNEAIEALKKEVENNPGNVNVYRTLADVQRQLRRYDDAIETLRGLLKVEPGDSQASQTLSNLLLEKHRYPEAIQVMESAVSENPEDGKLRFSLGSAHLSAGHNKEAEETFQKALQLDPSPGILNGIAYLLADANVDLSRAKEYGERAVSELEAESRKMTLSQLSMDDLKRVQDLSAYWDTLGWIHFRLNDLEKAEKYLKAAWILSQDPEECDHLGQVYERQGKLQEAARQYELALGTGHAELTETRERLRQLKARAPQVKTSATQTVQGPSGALILNVAAGEELGRMRTMTVPRAGAKNGTAEFFVLLSAGPKVEEVRFASGSEELRDAGKSLAGAHFDQPFPDENGTRIVRRGILMCSGHRGLCEFVLLTPDSVHSVN